jgi:hypothetical protein
MGDYFITIFSLCHKFIFKEHVKLILDMLTQVRRVLLSLLLLLLAVFLNLSVFPFYLLASICASFYLKKTLVIPYFFFMVLNVLDHGGTMLISVYWVNLKITLPHVLNQSHHHHAALHHVGNY